MALRSGDTFGKTRGSDSQVRRTTRFWEIESILTAQAEAWNRGDIDGFMKYYWNSDELTFNSGGETTRGWTRTREHYHKRYPTREQMGQLRFSQLETILLGDSAA